MLRICSFGNSLQMSNSRLTNGIGDLRNIFASPVSVASNSLFNELIISLGNRFEGQQEDGSREAFLHAPRGIKRHAYQSNVHNSYPFYSHINRSQNIS